MRAADGDTLIARTIYSALNPELAPFDVFERVWVQPQPQRAIKLVIKFDAASGTFTAVDVVEEERQAQERRELEAYIQVHGNPPPPPVWRPRVLGGRG